MLSMIIGKYYKISFSNFLDKWTSFPIEPDEDFLI